MDSVVPVPNLPASEGNPSQRWSCPALPQLACRGLPVDERLEDPPPPPPHSSFSLLRRRLLQPQYRHQPLRTQTKELCQTDAGGTVNPRREGALARSLALFGPAPSAHPAPPLFQSDSLRLVALSLSLSLSDPVPSRLDLLPVGAGGPAAPRPGAGPASPPRSGGRRHPVKRRVSEFCRPLVALLFQVREVFGFLLSPSVLLSSVFKLEGSNIRSECVFEGPDVVHE